MSMRLRLQNFLAETFSSKTVLDMEETPSSLANTPASVALSNLRWRVILCVLLSITKYILHHATGDCKIEPQRLPPATTPAMGCELRV